MEALKESRKQIATKLPNLVQRIRLERTIGFAVHEKGQDHQKRVPEFPRTE